MSLSRRLLLRASRSAWLARQLSQRAFFRRAVRRFMPGEDVGAALAAAADVARQGLGSVLTQLGEQVTSRDESARVRDHYLRLLEDIRQRQLPAEISVKLTHLGLDLNPKACLQDLLALAARAAAAGPSTAANNSAIAPSEFTYVFVAATACSSPASSGSTESAARASGESATFVTATVGRPCRRASASTEATSGDAPD